VIDDPDQALASVYAFGCFLVVLAVMVVIAAAVIAIGIAWASEPLVFQPIRMGAS
jgi:hypothetical protein